MYIDYYQFKENPFNITADPEYFFESAKHSEAYAHLVYGITQRKGILVVTGEIGTGKTTLCRTLLNNLDDNIKTAIIFNPNFSEVQLLQIILKDLGIKTKSHTRFALIDALNEYLLEQSNQGNNVVLIIDESQNLSLKQLEHVRLLSNLETEKEKLLQILLVGQPELAEKLKHNSLRQLNQRIAVRYHLTALTRDEIQEYIRHRLKVAKNSQFDRYCLHFTKQAVDAIYQHSSGTPRMVNILCDRALLAGFASDTFEITEKIIHSCAREVGHQ